MLLIFSACGTNCDGCALDTDCDMCDARYFIDADGTCTGKYSLFFSYRHTVVLFTKYIIQLDFSYCTL